MPRRMLMGSPPAADFSPLDVGWDHAWYVEGPQFALEGYTTGSSVDPWPDEVSTLDIIYVNGANATYQPTQLGGQPAVRMANSRLRTNARLASNWSQPYSMVFIAEWDATGGIQFAVDGYDSTPRVYLVLQTGTFVIGAGTNLTHATSADTDPHLFTAYFNGASSAFELDGVATTGNAGTGQLEGGTFGGRYDTGSGMTGQIAFIGWAQGDIRTDPAWGDFESWVTSKYGITI